MTHTWKSVLPIDPLQALLTTPDSALVYFVRRDLMEETSPPVETLWEEPSALRLIGKQQASGCWRYPAKPDHLASTANYDLLETYRSLRVLVERFGLTRSHPAIEKAAKYVFSCQTEEGDIRGILGNQYMPYYHAVLLELLIKAGYQDDPQTFAGLDWLLSMRQMDGGWIVPVQLIPASQKTAQLWQSAPLVPDRSKPHAHLVTGMVLRAFAVHPGCRDHPDVLAAGARLKERLFQPDKYNDRKASAYWLKFQFPFWWTSLLTSLDSLARLGFDRQDEDIVRGLVWFSQNQSPDGLWATGYPSGSEAAIRRTWVGLAACRVLKHFLANSQEQ